MSAFSNSAKETDRLSQLTAGIDSLYRWGSMHEQFSKYREQQDSKSEDNCAFELEEYQQQELDDIASLNKNFDIFGINYDALYHTAIVYEDGLLSQTHFQQGMKFFHLEAYTDALWELIHSHSSLSVSAFQTLFQQCRVSLLFQNHSPTVEYPISLSRLFYSSENSISWISTSDYRTTLHELFDSLQNTHLNYAEAYQYLHIESVDEKIVHMLGTILDLDLDTVLSIIPNSSQIEFTQMDSYMYFTLPWFQLTESGDEMQITKSMLHILLFKDHNLLITLKDPSTRWIENSTAFADPFSVFSVFSVFKRYHTRYHSSIASFLYLIDLHIDRIIQIVTHLVMELHRIEDTIIVNGVQHRLIIQQKQAVRMDFVQSAKSMFEKIQTDHNKLIKMVGALRAMVDTFENDYFTDIRKSEFFYLIRDIRDHMNSVQWAIDEGEKLCLSIAEKNELSADRRYNNLIYIVTVFQAIFLPLQTITAIYGMNFDRMPELRFYYGYSIFWIVCIIVAIVVAVPLFRFCV